MLIHRVWSTDKFYSMYIYVVFNVADWFDQFYEKIRGYEPLLIVNDRSLSQRVVYHYYMMSNNEIDLLRNKKKGQLISLNVLLSTNRKKLSLIVSLKKLDLWSRRYMIFRSGCFTQIAHTSNLLIGTEMLIFRYSYFWNYELCNRWKNDRCNLYLKIIDYSTRYCCKWLLIDYISQKFVYVAFAHV